MVQHAATPPPAVHMWSRSLWNPSQVDDRWPAGHQMCTNKLSGHG